MGGTLRNKAALAIFLGALPQVLQAQWSQPIVRAELLADTGAIRPGRPFGLGVLLHIQSGWHIYWLNPGEAGEATSVRYTLPDGFAAGAVQFPVPERFEDPGGIVGYGYTDSLLLVSEITAPKDLAPGTRVTLRARARWLSCKDACVPGEAELKIELPVATSAEPANAPLFAEWRDRLPVDADSPAGPAKVRVSGGIAARGSRGRFEIVLEWRRVPGKVEWFPGPQPALGIEDVAVRTEGTHTRITFSARVLSGQTLNDAELSSVVSYVDSQGQPRGIEVRVPLREGRGQEAKGEGTTISSQHAR
jgi:DsbC/DsbD-like thiol-disulfide interchange protein